MASRSLTRSLLTTARQTLISAPSRSYTAASSVAPPQFSFVRRLRPLLAAASASNFRRLAPQFCVRGFATRRTSSSLSDPNPNWSNRPPKETILLDGCDFEHWLIVMEKPEGDPTRDDIIDSYIKTLAMVVGSDEEARMKIYSVSTKHYFAFGALVSEELSYKIKELPRVRWVLPDSYLDVKNKDYGGEPFINGQAVPYDPKYHEEWVRNNARANERNRRNDRPRNFDRSRNFERRTQNMGGPSNMGGPNNMGGPSNMGWPANNMGGPSNMGGPANMGSPSNMGGPPNNMGAPPSMGGSPNNMGAPPTMGGTPNMGTQPNNTGGVLQPNTMGRMQQQPNMGGPSNMGGPANMGSPSNMGGPPNNMGAPPSMGGSPNMGTQPNNTGGVLQPNTMGRMQQPPNMGGPPNYMGGAPNNYPPNNMGGVPNRAPNYQYGNGPNNGGNNGGMPFQSGPGQNQNHAPNMGSAPGQNQSSYTPNMGSNQNSYAPNLGSGPGQNQYGYAPNVGLVPGQSQNYVPNVGSGNPYQNQNPNQS